VSRAAARLKLGALAGTVAGLALALWLLHSYGTARIVAVLARAGVLCSTLGWQAVAAPAGSRPPLRTLLWLRWIREAVNNLLPLAQVGGEFVAARLLQQRGVPLAQGIGGTIADLMLEMATQVVFTVLGLWLLVQATGHSPVSAAASRALLLAAIGVILAFALVRIGAVDVLEKAAVRMGKSFGWPATAQIGGVHVALTASLRSPGAVSASAFWHLASWILGGVEVCLALHYFGHDTSFASGLIIESLGQAAKSVGFAIPGALGVQEGGYVVVCALLGIPAQTALALSLIKRLREVVLGIPALLLWHRGLQ
jgi:putative membrane protein